MRIIDWLLEGDVIISYLTTNYLLDDPFDHNDQGYIGHYLDLYDSTKKFRVDISIPENGHLVHTRYSN